MIASGYVEQRNTYLTDLNHNLIQITKSIAKYNKNNTELDNKFPILKQSNLDKQIHSYQKFTIKSKKIKVDKTNPLKPSNRFIFNYKNSTLPSVIKSVNLKSLLLTSIYKHIDSKLLSATQSYGKNLFQLSLWYHWSLMTKYINTHKLDRKQLAQNLCDLINDDFEAYEATLGDDYHFVIDRNNNWRVNFSRHDSTYDIIYRYGENQMSEQIAIFNERLN